MIKGKVIEEVKGVRYGIRVQKQATTDDIISIEFPDKSIKVVKPIRDTSYGDFYDSCISCPFYAHGFGRGDLYPCLCVDRSGWFPCNSDEVLAGGLTTRYKFIDVQSMLEDL